MAQIRTLRHRLASYSAAAGVAAVGASSAQGAVIVFDSTHAFSVTPPGAGSGGLPRSNLTTHVWDIDNNGTNDFQLIGQHSTFSSGTQAKNVHLARIVGPPANHWVVAHTSVSHYTNTIKPLPHGFTIKATGMAGGAKFQAGSQLVNFTANGVPNSPLTSGAQYIGFEFFISGVEHYGWADITIGTNIVTVNNWAYESLGNTAIFVPAAPEPADAAVGLGLLALGAAGVSAYKRRKKQAVA